MNQLPFHPLSLVMKPPHAFPVLKIPLPLLHALPPSPLPCLSASAPLIRCPVLTPYGRAPGHRGARPRPGTAVLPFRRIPLLSRQQPPMGLQHAAAAPIAFTPSLSTTQPPRIHTPCGMPNIICPCRGLCPHPN